MPPELQLQGVEDVLKNLDILGDEHKLRTTRNGVTKLAKNLTAAATFYAPVGKGEFAGLLKDSIDYKVSRYPDGKTATFRAIIGPKRRFKLKTGTVSKGPRKGKPIHKIPANYAHLVEYGTVHSKAKPFMRPAWDQAGGSHAIEVFSDEVKAGTDRAIKKMKRAQAKKT